MPNATEDPTAPDGTEPRIVLAPCTALAFAYPDTAAGESAEWLTDEAYIAEEIAGGRQVTRCVPHPSGHGKAVILDGPAYIADVAELLRRVDMLEDLLRTRLADLRTVLGGAGAILQMGGEA